VTRVAEGESLTMGEAPGAAWLVVRGRLTAPSLIRVARSLEMLGRRDPCVVVLDLREVSDVDRYAVALIEEADAEARDRGGRLLVLAGRDVRRRVLALARDGHIRCVDAEGGVGRFVLTLVNQRAITSTSAGAP
jgi:ABC-type transporter Mla MlaB component